ncbi:mRNA decay factorlike protein [Perkinsela sp. CCAP 1560/4]|nr:mRNA decay factorlike protein [Perkinsela sp. CCAP 1560/4]|eukprot:KNH09523.1 mRNA decay factorlike protein [Perkinsela sp. CCAP 1560/4]
MRLQKCQGKALSVPKFSIPCSQLSRHIRVARSLKNLLFYHHYFYSRLCWGKKSKIPLNRNGDKTELHASISGNFNAIQSALEAGEIEKSIEKSKANRKGLNEYAYALYSLASPELIEKYLFVLASRSLRKYRSRHLRNASGDKKVTASGRGFSEVVSQIVLAYGRFFYNGKTTTDTDIRLLETLGILGFQSHYLEFAKDILSACVLNTHSKWPDNKGASCHLQKRWQHHSSISKDTRGRKALTPSHVTKIIGLVSKNAFLYDQKLIVSLCTTLQQCIEISMDVRRSKIMDSRAYPLTSFEAYQCILALHRMRHFHRDLRDLLIYMINLPQEGQSTPRSAAVKHHALDINHFIEALAVVVPYKDLIDTNDFLQFTGRVFCDKDYIRAKGASRLLSLVSMREIQNLYPVDTNAEDCRSSDRNSLTVAYQPRFHSRAPEGSEVDFTLQKENTNIIPSILNTIDSIILKQLPRMRILDVCRVVQGMASDYTCLGSNLIWSALLRRIDQLYSAKLRILHRRQKRLLLGDSSRNEETSLANPRALSIQRKVIVAAHATLLVLLPRIETRQASILEEEHEKIELDIQLLGKIASCIPHDSLEKNPRKFADIILVIRRAFCDFPQLYETDSKLWEIAKSVKVRDSKRSTQKLYRSSRRITYAEQQKDFNKTRCLGKESAEPKVRKQAQLGKYRRKNKLDCYRSQPASPGVHRFR